MKSLVFKFVLCLLLGCICVFVFSCCKTSDKKVESVSISEENVVKEIVNKNNNVTDDTSNRINAIYRTMIQNMKQETTYAASYTVQELSSEPFLWMDSLTDDGKYFYAVGSSALSTGRGSAKNVAQKNAELNLKRAAIQFSGDENIDVHAWELFEVCYKRITTDEGRTFYTANVLIGIDRNLVVKN